MLSLRPKVAPKVSINLNKAVGKKDRVLKVIEYSNQTITCESYSSPKWTKIEWFKDGQYFGIISQLTFYNHHSKCVFHFNLQLTKQTNKLIFIM